MAGSSELEGNRPTRHQKAREMDDKRAGKMASSPRQTRAKEKQWSTGSLAWWIRRLRRRFLHARERESRQGEIEMRAGERRHGSGASKEGEARGERGETGSGMRSCPRRGRGAVAGGGRRS